MKPPTGECPGRLGAFDPTGPGLELARRPPPGLGSWGLFNGELATRFDVLPPPGDGWGIIGLGLMAAAVGEARLNDVAGLEPNGVERGGAATVCGLAGVCGFEPDGGVSGGWKRRPGSLGPAGDWGPR